MAIEQWKPNIKAPKAAPMGPYRKGVTQQYGDYAAMNEQLQDNIAEAGKSMASYLGSMQRKEKEAVQPHMLENVVKDVNGNQKKGYDEALTFGEDGATPAEFGDLDKQSQEIALSRIQNMGAMSTQVQNIINEWAQGEPLTDENINWLQANANPEVAEFLVSISSGDGKYKWSFPNKEETDKAYTAMQAAKDERGFFKFKKNKAYRDTKKEFAKTGNSTVPVISFVGSDGEDKMITMANLQSATGSFTSTQESKDNVMETIASNAKLIGSELKSFQSAGTGEEGSTDLPTEEQQLERIIDSARKKAANMLGTGADKLSYEYVFTNFMKDDKGNINGSVGVKYDEKLHKDKVLDYYANMMIDQAPDAMALREKVKTITSGGGSGSTTKPDFYPAKISETIQSTFIEGLNATIFNQGQGPVTNLSTVVPLQGLENMQIKVGNSTKEIPTGGVEFDTKSFELKINEFDGEVAILDSAGDAVLTQIGEGQFVAGKTAKKKELKSYSLNDPKDFAKLYNDLGTDSKARKDDYATTGLVKAEIGFVGNLNVTKEIFNNNFDKWQTRINAKPLLAKELFRHVLKGDMKIGSGEGAIPITYYTNLRKRHKLVYEKLEEELNKQK